MFIFTSIAYGFKLPPSSTPNLILHIIELDPTLVSYVGEDDGFRVILQNPAQSPVIDISTLGSSIPADSNTFISVQSTIVSTKNSQNLTKENIFSHLLSFCIFVVFAITSNKVLRKWLFTNIIWVQDLFYKWYFSELNWLFMIIPYLLKYRP